MSRGFSSEKLELVTSMAEVALSEREDLGELDREDENRILGGSRAHRGGKSSRRVRDIASVRPSWWPTPWRAVRACHDR